MLKAPLDITEEKYPAIYRLTDDAMMRDITALVVDVMNAYPGLNALRNEALDIAVSHGFTDATVGEDLMLMVTEVAEAMEDHRMGAAPDKVWYETKQPSTHKGPIAIEVGDVNRGPSSKPCGIPSELADVIIRVLHFAGKHKIDIATAVREKMIYNASRPFKHGGKAL